MCKEKFLCTLVSKSGLSGTGCSWRKVKTSCIYTLPLTMAELHLQPPPPTPPKKNVPDWSIKTCLSQQERLSSNWKFHSQGTTFVWISVGDSIGPSGCAAVPKLKFSITVLRVKAVLSQFHYLMTSSPPPPHTQSWTHLILAWRQLQTCGKWICLLCAILLKQLRQLIAVWQGHPAFPRCAYKNRNAIPI